MKGQEKGEISISGGGGGWEIQRLGERGSGGRNWLDKPQFKDKIIRRVTARLTSIG